MRNVTPERVYESIAQALRTFGYPDCTAEMIKEVRKAMAKGKTEGALPHGIIGRFAEDQLKDAISRGLL